jgi:hypothetical protein
MQTITQDRDHLASLEKAVLNGEQVGVEAFASAKQKAQAEADLERLQKERQDQIDADADAKRVLQEFKSLAERSVDLHADNRPAEIGEQLKTLCVEFYKTFADFNAKLAELEREADQVKAGALNPDSVPTFKDHVGLDFGHGYLTWRYNWESELQFFLDAAIAAARTADHLAQDARQKGGR